MAESAEMKVWTRTPCALYFRPSFDQHLPLWLQPVPRPCTCCCLAPFFFFYLLGLGSIVRFVWFVVPLEYAVSANLSVEQLRAMKDSQNIEAPAFEHHMALRGTHARNGLLLTPLRLSKYTRSVLDFNESSLRWNPKIMPWCSHGGTRP